MATLAYCIKKMGKGMDPGIAKHLRDLSQDYQDMDMNKAESEVQAVEDVLDLLDKEYDSVVGEIHDRMKDQILQIETTPGRWFNFEFVRNNIPKLNARITELQKMFWDSKTFAKSDAYDGTYPIPVAGGIIAARQTKKYAKDPGYKKKVEGAIKDIQDNLIGANHTRMILLGNPDPAGQWGVSFQVGKVAAGYGVNVARAWNNEAKSKYPYTNYLGNVSVREGIQNSLDAVLEAIENGQIKQGYIDIKAYKKNDFNYKDSKYPVRTREIKEDFLDDLDSHDWYDSFEISDNGIGMSDVDIRDKFLALHGTGKDLVGRFGGFGIAKAVILGPHESSTWYMETNDNWHDGIRAQEADVVGTLDKPRQGTMIRVETDQNIISPTGLRYAETTEYPDNVTARYNGQKMKNPFARRKALTFQDKIGKDKNASDLEIKYYANPPKGYNKSMIIRLVDKQTGAKLTQGINPIYNEGFVGTMMIDVTTTQTPGGNNYPLTDSRMELKYDGKQLAEKIVGKVSVDPLTAKRHGIKSKWYALKDRSEWKNTVAKTKTDKGYQDLVKVVTGIWNESQKKIEFPANPYYGQFMPFTPIEELTLKMDVGFKGYKGGSMFHAKHILAFETIARMYSGAAAADIKTFYPLMSMPVDGGVVEGEYNGKEGRMGMNPLSIDKDATKSPLHYAIYLKGLIDHEFTHYQHGAHNEKFASAREETQKKTGHLFPQTLQIAEAVLQMPDKELTRDNVITEEKIREVIKEIPVEVSVETIRTEYRPLPMKQGMLFDSDTLIHEPQGVTPYEIKLYYPSRGKGIPRQLRLFDQRVVGRSPGRVSPAETKGDRGVAQLPDTQTVVQSGKRSGAFDGIDLTRAEEGVAKDAKKLPRFYQMPDKRIVRVQQSKFHDNKWTFYAVSPENFATGKKGSRLKIKERTIFDTEGEALTFLAKAARDRNYVPVKPAFGGGFVEVTPEALEARADSLRTLTKGIEYEYWGIPKDSKAMKVVDGDADFKTMKPESFTVNELRGLARMIGSAETGTKAEMLTGIIKRSDVADELEPFTLEYVFGGPVVDIADKFSKAQLQNQAVVLGVKPVGTKLNLADKIWRKYIQDRYHSLKGYVQFFEDIKKPVPGYVQELWIESQDLFHAAWGDALTVRLPEFAAAINPNYEKGGLVSTGELFDALKQVDQKLTVSRFKSMIRGRLRQDIILYQSKNPKDLPEDDFQKLIYVDGVYYGHIGKKGVSTVDVADLVAKIDSPALLDAMRSATKPTYMHDLGTQLGILGVEYPSVKKALGKASDKLKLRQAQAAAEADTDRQMSYLQVESVLDLAKDFIAATSGTKNRMSLLAGAYRFQSEPVKNESIIRQVFYGETPVRIQGPIEQFMTRERPPAIDTPAFKSWFGKSKVVDKKGEPLVVYHATHWAGFNVFEGTTGGAGWFYEAKNQKAHDRFAEAYGEADDIDHAAAVYPVFLKIENPFKFDVVAETELTQSALEKMIGFELTRVWNSSPGRKRELWDYFSDDSSSLMMDLENRGFDGVNIREGKDATWLAFGPTQIKSTFNTGAFSPMNPNIGYSTRQARERNRYLHDQGVTLDDVRRLFRGTNVFQRADGTIAVTTPTGHSLIIESMDSVDVNNAHFQAKVGRPLKKGETAIGKYYKGRIELHKDLANNWTLSHETTHWLEDVGYITAKEVDLLRDHIQGLHEKGQWDPKNIKDVGGSEDRANFIAWSINNRVENTSIISKIIQKFKDLLDGFVGLFKLTPQSIVRDLETGKMFRKPRQPFARKFLDPMFQVIAYHGTPHFFKRFRTRFIGEGEGSQAFGWGLYFTDAKSIAKDYANRLGFDIFDTVKWKTDAGETITLFKNEEVSDYGPHIFEPAMRKYAKDERHANNMAIAKASMIESLLVYEGKLHAGYQMGGNSGVVMEIQDQIDDLIDGYESDLQMAKDEYQDMKDRGHKKGAGIASREVLYNKQVLDYLRSVRPHSVDQFTITRPKTKAVYTVSLHKGKKPSEYDWVDWEKPLRPDQMKKLADQAIAENWRPGDIVDLEEAMGVEGSMYETDPGSGQSVYGLISKTMTINMDIGNIYDMEGLTEAKKQASLFLLRAGIDGVRFPSGTLSGIKDSPNFNYVVFDENAITVDTVEQYSTATPQDQQFMKDHGNSAAAEHVTRSMRDYAAMSWGRIGRWMLKMQEVGIGENPDTTAWERLLFTPIHYFNKVPAAGAMVEDATKRSDNYYKGLNWIEKDSNNKSRIQIGKKLKKTNKKEYRKINKYLDDNDMNKHGYTVRLAPQTEESTDRVYNIKDPDGKIVGTADDYDDGWGEAVRLEVAALAEQGYSELAQDWVQGTREMTHNVFNIMRGAINDLIKRYSAKEMSLPKVATFVDGQKVEVDLKVALAKMGDMRGYYMPRIRKPGNWSMYAKPKKGYEGKLHPILKHFELKTVAAGEASKKMYDNYIVDIVPLQKMSEDVFQIAGQVVAFQAMMNQALDQVSGNMKKGMAADVMKALERAQLEMGKTLAEGVANIFKGRGVRSHMIMRNDAVGTNVWKGYEEDSLQRMAKYVRGIAAGEAKKKMMLDMLRHMTGTDISWTEFKAEHAKAGLEANYPDYLTFVKNRRIDPINQRNIFHDALTYMEDMGRNDEGVDRLIGTVKGLAVLKYLGGRVSAPLVNLTALGTSVPASMRGYAKIPMRKVPGLLVEATKGWREYRRALKNGNEADIPEWMQKMYEEIEDKGWHTAQYNKEALSVLKSKLGNGYDSMIEMLMLGFGATEMLNRMSTISGAYIGQRKMNQKEWDSAGAEKRKVLHEEWMATAKEVSDKAHGVYSKANRPHYARGANPLARLAQMFYVFKTFSHNYLQTMYDLGFKTKDRTALLYMALAPAVVGGAAASPLIKVMMEAFGLMPGAPEEPEEAIYEWFENNFGEPVEQVVRLGAFGLGGYGVSLKGSLEIGVTDIPTSLKDLVGAPGSLVSDVVVGGKSILRGDWSKGLERMSPNFIGSGIKAWRETTVGVTTSSNAPLFYGRDTVKLDTIEAIFRTLSFNPARIAKIRERQWKERSVEHSMSELRHDIYARIKAFYNQPKSKRSKAKYASILEEIRTYNALVQRMSKPYPPITAQSVKNNLRRAFKPSKYERQRRLP